MATLRWYLWWSRWAQASNASTSTDQLLKHN